MNFHVKLTQVERELLASMIGEPIHIVRTDGCEAFVRCGSQGIQVHIDEVHTPDPEHPHAEVHRPRFAAFDGGSERGFPSVVGLDLGRIRLINVISTLFSLSAVRTREAIEIRGVKIPAGLGYGEIYQPPWHATASESCPDGAAVIDLDVAVEFITESSRSLVVYARGFFVVCSVGGLPTDEDWVRSGLFARRPVT